MQHYPASSDASRGSALVLAHGAGAGERHPFMIAFGRGLAAAGIDVITFDFPYMERKRRVPDKAPALEQRFRDVIDNVRAGPLQGRRLFIGGKSMGGRIATHLAAQSWVRASGLGVRSNPESRIPSPELSGVLALGYPLHPPGRPDQPRTAHLSSIAVPVLIVQGERDTFGTPLELEPVIRTMRARVTLHVVEGGDHSLKVRGRTSEQVYAPVFAAIVDWMRRYSV